MEQNQTPRPPITSASAPTQPITSSTPPTTDSIPPVTSPIPPQKTPKKSSKKSRILIIVLILLALAGIGVAVYEFILLQNGSTDDNAATTTTESTTQQTAVVADDHDQAVRDFIADLQNTVDELTTEQLAGGGSSHLGTNTTYDSFTVAYQPESAQVATSLEKTYGLEALHNDSFESSNKLDKLYQDVASALETKGFKKTPEYLWNSTEYLNSSTGIICALYDGVAPFSISCGHTSWISEPKIQLANNLAAAYNKANDNITYLDADESDIKTSNSPYQTIRAGISGAFALFYRTDAEADWNFVAAGQDAPACSEFNADAKKAFANTGTTCYDTATGRDIIL